MIQDMLPLYIDIAFAILAVVLLLQGWRSGFVRMAGSLIALVISVVVATWGIAWIESYTGWRLSANPVTFVIVFLVLTLILTKLMGFLIGLLDLVRRIFSIIPGVGLLNSLLGGLIGLVESALIASAVAFAAINFFPASEFKTILLASETISTVITYLIKGGLM